MSDHETVDQTRERAVAWIRSHWDPERTLEDWWGLLAEAGYAAPGLPVAAGGLGLGPDHVAAIRGALADHGCMGPPGGIGMMLAAPTIAAHGTPEQIARHVGPILRGQSAWCQLFSEPEAGSDLAALRCRAERDGDDWVVTGQKVWTSGGHQAEMGMLLARTDPGAPKREGITWFALPMRQPGVEVRPLREMTGDAVFNEVFLREARVRDSDRIGDLHDGWRVAATTLAVERASLGSAKVDLPAESPGTLGGRLGLRVGSLVEAPGKGDDFLSGTHLGIHDVEHWADLARNAGRHRDPYVRDGLARLHTLVRIAWWSAQRGDQIAGAANLAKLAMSDLFRHFREVGGLVVGAEGMLAPEASPTGGVVQRLTVFSPAPAIYGGTDQIQRNLIGERILGLPREPR